LEVVDDDGDAKVDDDVAEEAGSGPKENDTKTVHGSCHGHP
jgi:hypothetical protein